MSAARAVCNHPTTPLHFQRLRESSFPPDARSSIPDFNSPLLAASPTSLRLQSRRREIRSHWRGARASPAPFFRHRTTVSRRRPAFSCRRITFSRQRPDISRPMIALSERLPAARARQPAEPALTPGGNPHFNALRRDDRESGERCPRWCRLIPVARGSTPPRSLAQERRTSAHRRAKGAPHEPKSAPTRRESSTDRGKCNKCCGDAAKERTQ